MILKTLFIKLGHCKRLHYILLPEDRWKEVINVSKCFSNPDATPILAEQYTYFQQFYFEL